MKVLQRGAEHLSPNAYGRLLAGLDVGDPRGEVAAAYIACQELRHLYASPDTTRPGAGCTPSTKRAPTRVRGPVNRVRVPQLSQLSAPLAAALRRQLAHFPTVTDPRPITTFYGVEPH
jgi:hypothetical protein